MTPIQSRECLKTWIGYTSTDLHSARVLDAVCPVLGLSACLSARFPLLITRVAAAGRFAETSQIANANHHLYRPRAPFLETVFFSISHL